MHTDITMKERLRVLQEFIDQLERSGYDLDQRREILLCGLKGYENKLAASMKAGTSLYRSMSGTTRERRRKKMVTKVNWFKGGKKKNMVDGGMEGKRNQTTTLFFKHKLAKKVVKPDQKKPCAVIFIPRTPNGTLITLLREKEEMMMKVLRRRVKLVEEKGDSMKDQVWSSNPWASLPCGRQDCLVCFK